MTIRSFRIFYTLALIIITATTIAVAADAPTVEKTPVPMPPKPDFSSMRFLLGSWTCSTKSSRRPAAYVITSVTTLDPSGYWMVTKSTTHKMSWFPRDTQQTDYITHDSDTERWVDVYTADFGGYDVNTSPGWKGNTIVWTDALFKPGKDVIAVTPFTLTKVSDTKTFGSNRFQEKSGRWINFSQTCTKNG